MQQVTDAFTIETLTRAMEAVKSGPRIHPVIRDGREVYFMTISDHMRAMLVMFRVKAEWKERHRAARIARKAENGHQA